MRKLLVVWQPCWLQIVASPASAQTLVKDVPVQPSRRTTWLAPNAGAHARAQSGATPEALAALSWIARGTLAAGDRATADRFALDTERLTLGR